MTSTYSDRIQGVQTSVAVKAPVRVATTANITLSGTQTIDGVAVVAGDRVLVKDQTDGTENGIYVVASGAWTRAIDFNGARDVVQGTTVYVVAGTSYGLRDFTLTTASPVIGTSSLTFEAALTAAGAAVIAEAAQAAAEAAQAAAETAETNAETAETNAASSASSASTSATNAASSASAAATSETNAGTSETNAASSASAASTSATNAASSATSAAASAAAAAADAADAAAIRGSMSFASYTGDGSTTSFALPASASSVEQVLVFLEGAAQTGTTDFTLSGGNVVFGTAPADGSQIYIGVVSSVDIGTANASSVTASSGETIQAFINRSGGFATRAALVSALGYPWVAGAVVAAGGLLYEYDGISTAISDMPGWVPFGVASSLHWGIANDNTGDVGSSLQSAISAAYGAGFVEFRINAGTYRTTTAIQINDPINIYGDGPGQTIIMVNSSTASGIVARPDTLDGSVLSEFSISGMKITHPDTNATSGYALELRSCSYSRVEDIIFSNVANGVLVAGGTANELTSINGATQQGSLRTGSALVRFQPQDIGGGSYQYCYTHRFSNFNLSGGTGKTVQDGFDIQGVDGLQIINGHINYADRSLVKIEPLADGSQSNVTALEFSGVYFDGVSASTGTDYGLYVPDESVTGQIGRVLFNGGFIGNFAVSCVYARATGTGRFSFDGVNMSNATTAIVDIDLSSAEDLSNWSFTDCILRDAAGNGIVGTDAYAIQVKSCDLINITGTAVSLSGTIDSFHMTDVTFKDNGTNLSDSATISEKHISGCSGGVVNGGSTTPVLTFGGGSTGITYSTQICTYTIVDDLVFFQAAITLTSKGSSTGNAIINLSIPKTATENTAFPGFRITPLTAGATDRMMQGYIIGTTSQISIAEFGSAATDVLVSLTDVQFQNNTSILLSGQYRI